MTATDTTTEVEATEETPTEAPAPAVRQSAMSTLGVDVSGQTLDEALETAAADFSVELGHLTSTSSAGVSSVDDYRSIVREDTGQVLSVQGKGYTPIQYRTITELALDVVGLRPNDLALDRMGTWDDGGRFFASVDLGTLHLDPNGVNDAIATSLNIFSSHTGDLAVTLAEANVRLFCMNQAPALREKAKARNGGFYVKHTSGAFDRLALARKGLTVALDAREAFIKQAEALLAAPASEQTVRTTIRKIWGEPKDSDRARTMAEKRETLILGSYLGPRGVQVLGHNKWAVFNAFTEYLDHLRGTNATKRAVGALTPNSVYNKQKERLGQLLLA